MSQVNSIYRASVSFNSQMRGRRLVSYSHSYCTLASRRPYRHVPYHRVPFPNDPYASDPWYKLLLEAGRQLCRKLRDQVILTLENVI